MLLTDVWDALDGLAEQPPEHDHLRYIAQALGWDSEANKKLAKKKQTNATGDVGGLMQIGGRPKPASACPPHIKNSPTLQRMFAEMESANAG